ncbi:MAG: hypothetical protein JNK14_14135 [Chitinophagaceae bacterium]|nr:hypothetical protein [Chitinophagaceae bacterium]
MKKLLLFLPFFTTSCMMLAQVAGPQSARIFSNTSLEGSDNTWTDLDKAASSDQQYASFGDLRDIAGSHTDYLVATSFKFNIPAASYITGIAVYIECSDPSGSTSDHQIRIVKNGTIGNTEHSSGAMYLNLGDRDKMRTYGGNADLWGETWSPADINSDDFGVAISAQRAVTGRETLGRIDNIQVIVYYSSFTTLPLKLTAFSAELQNDKVRLNWTTTDESNMDRFELQRSTDGNEFKSFGTVICRNRSIASAYSFNDYAPSTGTSFYRLKILEKDGSFTYSKTVTIRFTTDNVNTLYPSPWKKGAALFIRNPGNEKLTIHFFNATGETIAKVSSSSGQVPVPPFGIMQGILRYKVFDEKQKITGTGSLMIY